MGKGGSSRESNVKKESADLISTSGSASNRGRKPDKENCLFSFQDEIILEDSVSQNISVSDDVAMTLGGDGRTVDVFIGNKYVGQYTGRHLVRMANCIKNDYRYGGVVTGIRDRNDGKQISYEIHGSAE